MNVGKNPQNQILENSKEEKQASTNLNSKEFLLSRLSTKKARERFVSSHADKGYAFQIREMREHADLSQTELGAMVGMNQNAIHRLESPIYGKATLTSLKRIAAAFDVALMVHFVPFSKLIDWVSGTAYLEDGLSSDSLNVPGFEEEKRVGAFRRVRTNLPVSIEHSDSMSEYVDGGTGSSIFAGQSSASTNLTLIS